MPQKKHDIDSIPTLFSCVLGFGKAIEQIIIVSYCLPVWLPFGHVNYFCKIVNCNPNFLFDAVNFQMLVISRFCKLCLHFPGPSRISDNSHNQVPSITSPSSLAGSFPETILVDWRRWSRMYLLNILECPQRLWEASWGGVFLSFFGRHWSF